MIEHIEVKDFTVFHELKTDLVPGVNLFIGENGTGKTHLLKLLYSFHAPGIKKGLFKEFADKLLRVFLPQGFLLKRLVRRGKGSKEGFSISITKNGELLTCTLKDDGLHTKLEPQHMRPSKSVYIPVKEMLANAPGFRSLYNEREIHFEEIYADIIDKALLPPLKSISPEKEKILKALQKAMGGKVLEKNEVFFLKNKTGETEFTLVAEGMRKLALIWLLIRNGSIEKGSTLYWDEPEANLNPSMLPLIVMILLEMERMGVQIFIATHSYALLKEFDLQCEEHSLRFYSLFMGKNREINLAASDSYLGLSPNRIADQFARMYNLEIDRAMGGDNG